MKNFQPPKVYSIEKVEKFIKTKNISYFPGCFRWGKPNTLQGYMYWRQFYDYYSSLNFNKKPIEKTSAYKYLRELLHYHNYNRSAQRELEWD